MSATIITGRFDKPVELPKALNDTLSWEQQEELRALAKAWNTTMAGAVLNIIKVYLQAREQA